MESAYLEKTNELRQAYIRVCSENFFYLKSNMQLVRDLTAVSAWNFYVSTLFIMILQTSVNI